MATKSGTKTAASRSLDYTLRSDVLNRVKEAGRTTGRDRDGGRDGLTNLTKTLTEGKVTEHTGDREVVTEESQSSGSDAEIIQLKKLAGLN